MKKLIIAIVSADAVEPVSGSLVEARYAVTQISSVGGFLRRGSTTMVIGVEESQIEDALRIIRERAAPFSKGGDHAATVFVISASQFIQL